MVKEYFLWEGEFKNVGKDFNQGKIFKWGAERELEKAAKTHGHILNCKHRLGKKSDLRLSLLSVGPEMILLWPAK